VRAVDANNKERFAIGFGRRAGASVGWSRSAKVSIVSNVVLLVGLVAAWYGLPAAAPLPYTVHKLLHIVGVVIFMGNLVAGPLWLWLAYLQGDAALLKWAAVTLSEADVWLTTPGVQLTMWNGLWLAAAMGGVAGQPWLREAVVLVVIAAALSLGLVLPLQERMVARAAAGDRDGTRRAMIGWSVWGSVVMVPFSLVGWLMVSKASLFS
jgi:uncharacterized membrane protein